MLAEPAGGIPLRCPQVGVVHRAPIGGWADRVAPVTLARRRWTDGAVPIER